MPTRRLVSLLTLLLALAALAVSVTPSEAVHYSAGIERPGTNICKCPVQIGDCVCEFTY